MHILREYFPTSFLVSIYPKTFSLKFEFATNLNLTWPFSLQELKNPYDCKLGTISIILCSSETAVYHKDIENAMTQVSRQCIRVDVEEPQLNLSSNDVYRIALVVHLSISYSSSEAPVMEYVKRQLQREGVEILTSLVSKNVDDLLVENYDTTALLQDPIQQTCCSLLHDWKSISLKEKKEQSDDVSYPKPPRLNRKIGTLSTPGVVAAYADIAHLENADQGAKGLKVHAAHQYSATSLRNVSVFSISNAQPTALIPDLDSSSKTNWTHFHP